MIGCPEPVVLHVNIACALGNVYIGVGGHTLILDTADRALSYLKLCTLCTTDSGMNIPKSRTLSSGQVVFNELSSWRRSLGTDQEVRKLDAAAFTSFANLNDRNCVSLASPGTTTCQDDWVCFADDPCTGGKIECFGDLVVSMVQKEYLFTRGDRVDRILKRSSIISASITLSASGTSADEVADCQVLILRLGLCVVLIAIKETLRADRCGFTLELGRTARIVFVALCPAFNSRRTACENCTAWSFDSDGNVAERNVLQNELSSA